MSDQESTREPIAAETVAAAPGETIAYEPAEEGGDWLDATEELPPRPRRRLLAPAPLALLGVLLLTCGFIAGVLVEKSQTSTSSTAAAATGFASRLAGPGQRSANAGAGAAVAAGAGGGRGGIVGQVAFLRGHTLYVTTVEGNTVKVSTSGAATVTKTVTSSVKAIHPGESVLVTGPSAANGAIDAESIRVGAGAGAGLGGLLGGATSGFRARAGGGGAGADAGAGGGEPALFGKG